MFGYILIFLKEIKLHFLLDIPSHLKLKQQQEELLLLIIVTK